MPTYASLVTVEDAEFQNVQDLASLWGDIRTAIERFGVSIEQSYTVGRKSLCIKRRPLWRLMHKSYDR